MEKCKDSLTGEHVRADIKGWCAVCGVILDRTVYASPGDKIEIVSLTEVWSRGRIFKSPDKHPLKIVLTL